VCSKPAHLLDMTADARQSIAQLLHQMTPFRTPHIIQLCQRIAQADVQHSPKRSCSPSVSGIAVVTPVITPAALEAHHVHVRRRSCLLLNASAAFRYACTSSRFTCTGAAFPVRRFAYFHVAAVNFSRTICRSRNRTIESFGHA